MLGLLGGLGSKEMAIFSKVIAAFDRFKKAPTVETFRAICHDAGFNEKQTVILWQGLIVLLGRYNADRE